MARYKARWGASTYLGDEVRRWSARPGRLTRDERPLLWATHAAVADDSANVVWRIEVVVAVKANSAGALALAVEGLAAAMIDDGLSTLTIRDYTADTAVRTYANCRLDAIAPGPPPREALAHLDDALTFTFTSASDPA